MAQLHAGKDLPGMQNRRMAFANVSTFSTDCCTLWPQRTYSAFLSFGGVALLLLHPNCIVAVKARI
jgi:hypothetical protein